MQTRDPGHGRGFLLGALGQVRLQVAAATHLTDFLMKSMIKLDGELTFDQG